MNVTRTETVYDVRRGSNNEFTVQSMPEIYDVDVTPYQVVEVQGGAQDITVTKVAGETLGGHRAVCIKSDGKAYYADANTLNTKAVIGITTQAVNNAEDTTIQTEGEIQNAGGWSFTVGEAVFVGTNGQIVQTETGSAYACILGIATAADKINLSIFTVIKE